MSESKKIPVRIAYLSGYGIKKRGRKEHFFCFEGVGHDNVEACKKMMEKFRNQKANLKDFMFKSLKIQDGIRHIAQTYTSLEFSLFPTEKDNLIVLTKDNFDSLCLNASIF